MRLNISTSGGFENITKKLQKAIDGSPKRALSTIGKQGVGDLASATPRDTGATAESWDFKVHGWINPELVIFNTNRTNTGLNLAVLIQVGHGTGTGGYVPPINYIRPAMNRTFKEAGRIISEEMMG